MTQDAASLIRTPLGQKEMSIFLISACPVYRRVLVSIRHIAFCSVSTHLLQMTSASEAPPLAPPSSPWSEVVELQLTICVCVVGDTGTCTCINTRIQHWLVDDMSLLERCPHFRGCSVQAHTWQEQRDSAEELRLE